MNETELRELVRGEVSATLTEGGTDTLRKSFDIFEKGVDEFWTVAKERFSKDRVLVKIAAEFGKLLDKVENHLHDNYRGWEQLNEGPDRELKDILRKHKRDYDKLKKGDLEFIFDVPDLYDALYGYYLNSGEMPYGVAKARTGDPEEWITNQLEKEGLLESLNEYRKVERGLVKILKKHASAYQKLLRGAGLDQNTSVMNKFYEDLAEYYVDSGDMPYTTLKGDQVYKWMKDQLEKDGVFGESLEGARAEDSLRVLRGVFYGLEDGNDYGLGNLIKNVRDDRTFQKLAKASVALTKKLEKHLHKNYPDWEKRNG